MTSDMLRFFRMGFLCSPIKELVFDRQALEDSVLEGESFRSPSCRGPYSQVTSHSFNLEIKSIHRTEQAWRFLSTYQLSVSGDTVLRLFFDFIHVRQDAFSNLALFGYSPRRDTMYLHEDQISSSLHSCDR